MFERPGIFFSAEGNFAALPTTDEQNEAGGGTPSLL